MTDHLTVAEVLAIHADQIARYGGPEDIRGEGIRDMGLLESALFRPQTGYYEDEIAQAAALWESLAQNHPFVDGNKRTAFAVTYTFLAINAVRVTAGPEETYRFIIDGLERGDFRFSRLEDWLRQNTVT